MKKKFGLALGVFLLLAGMAWAKRIEIKTYTQQVLGASASATFTVDQPYASDWADVEYVVFFLKTASTSGTVTATAEMVDGSDLYALPFNITSTSGTSLAASTGAKISDTSPGTAGNYIVQIALADFGHQVLGPIRLKIATAGASGATVNVKSSVYASN